MCVKAQEHFILRDLQIVESDQGWRPAWLQCLCHSFWHPCSLDSVRSNGNGNSSSVGCIKRTPFRSQVLPIGAICGGLLVLCSIVSLLDMVKTGFITVQWMVLPVCYGLVDISGLFCLLIFLEYSWWNMKLSNEKIIKSHSSDLFWSDKNIE